MTEDSDWKKLATEGKCQHKSWKARVEGYEECAKNFALWDEKSKEYNKYLDLLKQFVADPNEPARLQGIQAVSVFVEKSGIAGQLCSEVISGIVSKCFNAKPKLKEAAVDVCLMYIEIDKASQTIDELLKGFLNKQPKVIKCCVETITKALCLFGNKVIQIQPILSKISNVADHKDENVRSAVKELVLEISRWTGPAITDSIKGINPVMLKELKETWGNTSATSKPVTTRFTRSCKASQLRTSNIEQKLTRPVKEEVTTVCLDELSESVEILSKLPKDFYVLIQSKQWKERREMLQACQKLCEIPNIEPGDFSSLVAALKKVISNDNNAMLVIMASKSLAGLARGIRKKFQPFAISCMKTILKKLKDKKPAVIDALHEAADAIYHTTTMQALSETCIEHLKNKNPSVLEQTALFLARHSGRGNSGFLDKNATKPLTQALLKNTEHGSPAVRDASSRAIGALLQFCGEKMILPLIANLDAAKLEKIKEHAKLSIEQVVESKPDSEEPEPVKSCLVVSSCLKPNKHGVIDEDDNDNLDDITCMAHVNLVPANVDESDDAGSSIDCLVTGVASVVGDTISLSDRLFDKDVLIRQEALDEVLAILNKDEDLQLDLRGLLVALEKCLMDCNKTLVLTAVKILDKLSVTCSKSYDKIIVPHLFVLLEDTESHVRQAACDTINSWFANASLSLWLENGTINAALSASNCTLGRAELLSWLTKALFATADLTALGKQGLESCTDHLMNCLEDRENKVRQKARNALPAFIFHLGSNRVMQLCDAPIVLSTVELVRNRTQNSECSLYPDDLQGSLVQSVPQISSCQNSLSEKQDCVLPSREQARSSENFTLSKKKIEQTDSCLVFIRIPNGKEQRMKDEELHKTLKWAFNLPRDDLISQLKSQLRPCTVPDFFMKLFHKNLKHHTKAIVLLTEALDKQWDETIDTVDLILRWVTLKFYDKNNTLLARSLKYLLTLFDKLTTINYQMTDYEAEAFIPHLVTRIGDTKDSIRDKVLDILDLILKIHLPGKVIGYLLSSLSTKNSRVKAECLMEIGFLITTYGIDVCHLDPVTALTSISAFVADRDGNIRSAALNAMVAAYGWCGNAVYKFIGNIDNDAIDILKKQIGMSGQVTRDPSKYFEASDTTVETSPSCISVDDMESSNTSITDESSVCKDETSGDLLEVSDCEDSRSFHDETTTSQNGRRKMTACEILDKAILDIGNRNILVASNAAILVYKVLEIPQNMRALKSRIDNILARSGAQLNAIIKHHLKPTSLQHDADFKLRVDTTCKYLFLLSCKIWKNCDLALCATQKALENYFCVIIKFISSKEIEILPHGKRLKYLAQLVLEDLYGAANSTDILCAMVSMVYKILDTAENEHMYYSFRGLWRLLNFIPKYISPSPESKQPCLECTAVLNEINWVMNSCLSKTTVLTDRNMTAIKSMRSLTYTLCKGLGVEVLEHVQDIDGIRHSELLRFIIKTLKIDYPAEEVSSNPVYQVLMQPDDDDEHRFERNSKICKERLFGSIIENLEKSKFDKCAVFDLYKFKQDHPQFDIEKHLSHKDLHFINYMQSHLRTLEQQEKESSNSTTQAKLSRNTETMTLEERFELMKSKRIQYGIHTGCAVDKPLTQTSMVTDPKT